MKTLFALLLPPQPPAQPDDTPEDIEIYVRRRRGRNQGKFYKLHILIIEIVALLLLLIGAAAFIKHELEPVSHARPANDARQVDRKPGH